MSVESGYTVRDEVVGVRRPRGFDKRAYAQRKAQARLEAQRLPLGPSEFSHYLRFGC